MYSALYYNVHIIDEHGKTVQHEWPFKNLEEHECRIDLLEKDQIGGQLSSLVCRNFWKLFNQSEK